MINKFRFILEPYKGRKTRYYCPYCNHKDRKFARYIDTETGEHLASHVGKCERLDSCGAHYKPKQFFLENIFSIDTCQPKEFSKPNILNPKPISFIPNELFKSSLKNYESNNFIKFLIELFGVEITSYVVSRYFIGTSKHWPGSSIFWQVDTKGKVRTGKIMLYDATTGKRIRKPFDHITWVHSLLKQPDFGLKQCLFGEHLLIDESRPVAIVESEKTAIIASVYLPQFIWLAVGGKNHFNLEICRILKGRSVSLFPDLNAYEGWTNKANGFSDIRFIQVSDLLHINAIEDERKKGLDLADYLLRFNYKLFNLEPLKTTLGH